MLISCRVERGGIDQYDFNISFNINDRFTLVLLWVLTMWITTNILSMMKCMPTNGRATGRFMRKATLWRALTVYTVRVSTFKFGAIFRPIEDSPLRIGLAVHTPTYYKLTYTTGALLTSDLFFTE